MLFFLPDPTAVELQRAISLFEQGRTTSALIVVLVLLLFGFVGYTIRQNWRLEKKSDAMNERLIALVTSTTEAVTRSTVVIEHLGKGGEPK